MQLCNKVRSPLWLTELENSTGHFPNFFILENKEFGIVKFDIRILDLDSVGRELAVKINRIWYIIFPSLLFQRMCGPTDFILPLAA